MLPNIRLPRVRTRLTTMTVKRKNIRLRNEVTIRQRFRNCLSFFILICSCSALGRSRVKSDSGLVEGCKEVAVTKGIRGCHSMVSQVKAQRVLSLCRLSMSTIYSLRSIFTINMATPRGLCFVFTIVVVSCTVVPGTLTQ